MFLRLALVIALALGIYAGTKFGSLGDNPSTSTINTLKDTRDANAIICLAITVIAGIVALLTHFKHSLPTSSTGFVLLASVLLSVVSIYKIVLYERTPPPSPVHTGTKVGFYLLVALPEYLVTVLFLSINLNTSFEIDETKRRKEQHEIELEQEGYANNRNNGNGNMNGAGAPMGMSGRGENMTSTPKNGYAPVNGAQGYNGSHA